MSRTFHSLQYPNYRLWFVGTTIANTGTWMLRTAMSWLVLTELTANDAIAVGLVVALQFGPALIFSPMAGALADQSDRRRLLMVTQGFAGLSALLLGLLVLSGSAELWQVFVFAAITGSVAAFDSPARQTYVSDMVPPKDLPNAVGLNSTSFNIARLIGPAVAGLAIAAIGTGWVFVVTGLLFSGTVGALMLQRVADLNPVPRPKRTKHMVRDGLAYVRSRSDIVIIMVVVGVTSALGLNFAITSAVMATEAFGKEAGEYGIIGSVTAIGSLTGALLAARRRHPRVRLVVISAFAFGVTTILSAVAPTFELYLAASALVGLSTLTMLTSANATIQTSTDPQMRGRVMSLYMMVLLGTTPLGAPLVGWIANEFGARWSVAVGGISAVLVAVVAAIWVWRFWELTLDYRAGLHPHFHVLGPTERHTAEAEEERRAERAAATEAERAAAEQAQRAADEQAQEAGRTRTEAAGVAAAAGSVAVVPPAAPSPEQAQEAAEAVAEAAGEALPAEPHRIAGAMVEESRLQSVLDEHERRDRAQSTDQARLAGVDEHLPIDAAAHHDHTHVDRARATAPRADAADGAAHGDADGAAHGDADDAPGESDRERSDAESAAGASVGRSGRTHSRSTR